MTDREEVVARARQGDSDAWRELYRAHAGRLVVWLSTRADGDSAVDPEDIAAETWLTAARRIASFSGDEADFAGWLFGIARKVAANNRRRVDRRGTDPVPDAAALATASPTDHASAVAEVDWVRSVLALLSPRERDVLTCVDVVGLDVTQTSQALGMTPVSVRVARHRGLRRLRAMHRTQPQVPTATVAQPI